MDELTMTVKSEIKRQYKSVRQFAAAIDIPQSTIISGLRKGIGGMAFDTVLKMCSALGVKLSVNSGVFMDKEKSELLEYFGELDDRGRYTVKSVCNVELLRCRNVPVTSMVAALDKIQNSSGDKNEQI